MSVGGEDPGQIYWTNLRREKFGLASRALGASLMAQGFPGGSDSKEPACNAGDPGSIPGLGRFPR